MNLTYILDIILIEYYYWKKYGIFPEDDYTIEEILLPYTEFSVRGGRGNCKVSYWTNKIIKKIYSERYYLDYYDKINLLK